MKFLKKKVLKIYDSKDQAVQISGTVQYTVKGGSDRLRFQKVRDIWGQGIRWNIPGETESPGMPSQLSYTQ